MVHHELLLTTCLPIQCARALTTKLVEEPGLVMMAYLKALPERAATATLLVVIIVLLQDTVHRQLVPYLPAVLESLGSNLVAFFGCLVLHSRKLFWPSGNLWNTRFR